MRRRRWILPVVLLVAIATGCGGDDGADVRNVGGGGTGTGAGTATGTGATGTGTGAATGTGATGTGAEAACDPVGDATDADTTVAVELQEWAVVPADESAPAGVVTFEAENIGAEPHELVVVEAENVNDLPTTSDGAFDEDAYGDDKIIGEIEPFPSGENCEGTFELAAGEYVLLCNIVEQQDGRVEAHYQMGMRTPFTVS